jgi:hypothetical protein
MNTPVVSNNTVIEKTAAAVRDRGIAVEIVNTRADALERIKSIIPAGVSVMTGASLTLKEIGFEDYLVSKTHPWKNLKEEVLAEKDPAKQAALRKKATLTEFILGSS